MSKTALRYLSLGLLLSAIVLAGYRVFFYDAQISADKATTPSTELSQEEETYKEKYEQLLAETEVAKIENDYAAAEESTAPEAESAESTESSEDTEDAEDTENEADDSNSEEDASNEPITTTVVINEGEPSSIAATQLQNQGIIESANEFNDYLEENNFTTLVRPGSFTVNSDMSFQEIADVLMSES